MKYPILTLLLALVLPLHYLPAQAQDAGRSGGSRAEAGAPESGVGSQGFVAPMNYRIRAGDIISIQIFKEPELGRQVRVEADGSINLHLVGKVKVEGMTVSDARELIRELYDRDFLVNPQIDLLVIDFNLERVQILGQVNRPGIIAIEPDRELTLLHAIALAGDFTRMAKRNSVQVRRTLEDGSTQVFIINASQLINNPAAEDFPLVNGDLIFVDERII